MRVISGKFKGRKLADCSKLIDLRPTTDWTREALFNILQSGKFLKETQFNLQNCNFLDACCGSGAVGIEALSRGAKKVFFVDNHLKHLQILEKNITNFKINENCQIINCDINSLKEFDENLDLIFLDPPYNANYQKIIKNLIKHQLLKSQTLLVVEFDTKKFEIFKNFLEENLTNIENRKYGKSLLGFYQIKKTIIINDC